MNSGRLRLDRDFDGRSIACQGGEFPLKSRRFAFNFDFPHVPKCRWAPLVPQYRLAKDHAERQVIHQRFKRARCSLRAGEIRMRPAPVRAVAVSGVVALHAKAERLPRKSCSVKKDLSRKDSVRMWGLRKSDPPFIAQDHPEIRAVTQSPGDGVTACVELPPARISFDATFGNVKVEGKFTGPRQLQSVRGIAHNKSLRLALSRKPCRPNLHRQARRLRAAPISPRIHQQIAEPPGAASIRQSATQEPHLVSAFHVARGIDRVHVAWIQAKTLMRQPQFRR